MSHLKQLVLYSLSSGGFMSTDTKESLSVTGELNYHSLPSNLNIVILPELPTERSCSNINDNEGQFGSTGGIKEGYFPSVLLPRSSSLF